MSGGMCWPERDILSNWMEENDGLLSWDEIQALARLMTQPRIDVTKELETKLAAETARADAAERELAELKRVIAEAAKQEPWAYAFKVWDGQELREFSAIDYEPKNNGSNVFEIVKEKRPLYLNPIPAQRTEQPAQAGTVVPDGWQLVPSKITEEMDAAHQKALRKAVKDQFAMRRKTGKHNIKGSELAYLAMLAAAPKPEGETN